MPRLVAWRILRSGAPTPTRLVDRYSADAGLDERDRAFVRRLVGTEVRRRGSLRAIVRHFARKPPNVDLLAHLHLGLVQLLFMDRVPDHAAVNETSRVVHTTSGPAKVRFVNGLLRNVLRARRDGRSDDPRCDLPLCERHLAEPVFRDPAEHPYLWIEDALSLPASLAKRWHKRHGWERTLALGRAALTEPPVSVRAVAIEREALFAELSELGLEPRPSDHPRILLLDPAGLGALRESAAFREGRATVQGGTALTAAELLGAQEGETVLDLAAAPGGKTAVLAEAGARVVAVDSHPARSMRLTETIARLRQTDRVWSIVADGAGAFPAERFDAALVDVPCSNSGVLAQRPEARWRFGPAARRALGEIQTRLLTEAARCVRPGGRIVYSTCSLEPEENGQLVRAFLAAASTGSWELEVERETLGDPAGAGPIDGGYAARLVRT